MTEPTDTCINCGERLAYGVDPSCCSWSCDANLRRKLTNLTAEVELSKRVVTAHRKLCDERAAKIKELEAALTEAEAIVMAAERAFFPVVLSGAKPDGINTVSVEEWDKRQQHFHKLLSARREKGGAK